uniref:Defective in cullin neddylation protein n=1 Tax=Globodera pallida TaxID=36090 RepID=A0A183BT98_GLOPA
MVCLLCDLGIDPTSRAVMVLAWKMQARKQCEFTQQEFREWLTALMSEPIGTLSPTSVKTALMKAAKETVAERQKFRELYQIVFKYVKLASQTSLELQTAVPAGKSTHYYLPFGQNANELSMEWKRLRHISLQAHQQQQPNGIGKRHQIVQLEAGV